MTGIYFSGTGNSRWALEVFLREYEGKVQMFSIEDENALREIEKQKEIVFSYPVQYSNLPKMVRDYIVSHQELWKGKHIFIIATMGMFSGDGAGVMGRLLEEYGAKITGGLHLRMPDSICDEKVLKKSLEENKKLVADAEKKIKTVVKSVKSGNPPKEGLGFWSHLAGLLGQRLWFSRMTSGYSDKVKIDGQKCIGCGKCVKLCRMNNLELQDGNAATKNQCTMCYRCVNRCPVQAITLLGKNVIKQGTIEDYTTEGR